MHWAMVGWSHHETPVELRERLAFSNEQVFDALQQFKQRFPNLESVLLSTCNRVELYCASQEKKSFPQHEELCRFLTDFHGLQFAELKPQATALSGEESIHHLFTVAASLDSMVIGEAQILSQVKAAYELACRGESVATNMHRVFQRAALVAKRVANETEIHQKRISVPSVAVSEIATEFFERFEDKKILLIGAGEMGTETLKYLKDFGATKMSIINRSVERAKALAVEFEAETHPWEKLYSQIMASDMVVSTTGASEPIVTLAEFQKARIAHPARAVLILDLAVPRDFEATISDVSDTYLYTVDDLQEVCQRNIEARKAEWPKAKKIVQEETKRFLSESSHRGGGSTIKLLREQAEGIKKSELERLFNKLDSKDLDEATKKELQVAFDRLVNKLLHPPMQSLRENADSQQHASLLDALRRLFQLGESERPK